MQLLCVLFCLFFFSSRRRHTRCALVTGVQTCALPIYEGGFAVINAAASDETQQRLVLMLFQIGVNVLRDQRVSLISLVSKGRAHQKYPSCFFFSIEAA